MAKSPQLPQQVQSNQQQKKSSSEQVVVAIGASAGGLEALQDFFKNMPPNNNLAFVVIQHLSPDYKSMMDELLARHTKMTIHIIEDGMQVEPNTIYLIPPRVNLSIFHDKLYVEEYSTKKGLNLPIDIFFRSLAQEKGKDGIGIILSGTGSDGALGTRAIKEVGGMIMVQDEQSAKFDGMPKSSIATGLVDYILPPEKMSEALLDYIKHPFIEKGHAIDNLLARDFDTLTKITMVLRDYCGIDFSYYKSNTIVRRLERRVSINRCNSIEEYLLLLSQSEKEKEALFRDLLIGVTRFFRDPEAFQYIAEQVIPVLVKSQTKNLRIWSTGCSTGEEVYSLAMLINEYIERKNLDIEVKIFATDIDRHALAIASNGFYPDNILVDVDANLLNKYFNRIEGGYQVKESIRRMIVFATHNLLKDPPFSKLDMLICRNLFIYLKTEIQVKLLNMFYFSLNTNGVLFMGSSESIGEMTEAFSVLDAKNKIYSQRPGYKTPLGKELTITTMNSFNDGTNLNNRAIANKSERLLEKILPLYMPPAIIIDGNDEIIQIVGDINYFININQGKFSQSLYAILPEGLALFVANFLRLLRKNKKATRSENIIELIVNNQKQFIKLEGHYIETDKNIYYLLVFHNIKTKEQNVDEYSNIKLDNDFSERIHTLEKELQLSREALQATIEELETSNEELQSSNEELIASNEELQSTNEELQSVNEELYTVNSEFQLKISELERMNNDMNNLIVNTEIGALYLDRNLCIRKITPSISKITNIIPSDIGRPISHIADFDKTQTLMLDILKVTETLQTIENEHTDSKGNYYLVRTRPYRVESNAVDGILVTFVIINSYKKEQEKLIVSQRRLHDTLDFAQMAWWEWDLKSNEVIFDDKKATMIGYTPEEFPKNVYKVCDLIHPDDYEMVMSTMRSHLDGETDKYIVSYRIKRKEGGYAWYYDRGAVSERNEKGAPLKVVGSVIDITVMKENEIFLKEQNHLLFSIINNIEAIDLICLPNAEVLFMSQKFKQFFNCENTNNVSDLNIDNGILKITDIFNKKITQVKVNSDADTSILDVQYIYKNDLLSFITIIMK